MSRVWYHQHAEDEAVEGLRAMIAKLQGLRPSRILADLHEELAAHLLAVQRWTEALAALGRQEEMARVFGYERAVVVSQVMRGMLLEESGQVDEGLQMLERLLPALEKAGTPLDPDGALNHLRLWCLVRGDLRRSFGQVERRLAIHRRRRDPRSLTETLLDHGRMAFLRGSWDQAQVDFEEALETLADYPEPMLRAYVLSALGMLRTLTGDRVGGAHHLERCRAEAPALMGQRYPYELTLVYDDMLNGRPAAARATLQEIRDDSRYRGPLETLMFPILAQTYLASGEPEGASRILDQAKERAHAEGSRLALLEILRVEAMLLTHVGQADEAMHAAEDALSEALIIGLPYHAARLLDVCAALHVDRGEAQRARERLNEALAFFRSLGARPDVERVERALAAVEETSRAR
jgi:tetratricopeptide (TPR) repeat protein